VHLQPLFSGLLFSCLTVTAASLAAGAGTPETRAPVETLVGHANDAEITVALPVNRPADAYYDWTGAYIGAHLGYAAGSSRWSATEAGAISPNFTGSLDFYKGFNFSKGTGSYFGGFQAGYNYMLPSRVILGLEGDVSFPNSIKATQLKPLSRFRRHRLARRATARWWSISARYAAVSATRLAIG